MGILETFTKRMFGNSGVAAPLQIVTLPQKLRNQMIQILIDAIGHWQIQNPNYYQKTFSSNIIWERVTHAMRREYGRFEAPGVHEADEYCSIIQRSDTNECLDYAECALAEIVRAGDYFERCEAIDYIKPRINSLVAVEDFNLRCLESSVGCQFMGGKIVPVSSTYAHTEIVECAYLLLHNLKFKGAQDEFQRSLHHLRKGDTKSAINEAGKAFESTMKTICDIKKRTYDRDKATSKDLLDVLHNKHYFPEVMNTQFTGLRSVLESGVQTPRNKRTAHGQGAVVVEVSRELAEFVIRLAAANIIFLADQLDVAK